MNTSRWEDAQEYEKNWWARHSEAMDPGFYKYYADELLDALKGLMTISDQTRILEIGSGAAGILTCLKNTHRFAIDPLEDYYSTVEKFVQFRDPSVRYFKAKGEKIPFDDLSFDLIIMDNVLDHCERPHQVMVEICRVLKQGGMVFFRQNTYHLWGTFIRNALEGFQIDKGHPHTFTKHHLENEMKALGLTILKRKRRGYFRTWARELTSGKLIDLVKAFLFATRDKTLYVVKKTVPT